MSAQQARLPGVAVDCQPDVCTTVIVYSEALCAPNIYLKFESPLIKAVQRHFFPAAAFKATAQGSCSEAACGADGTCQKGSPGMFYPVPQCLALEPCQCWHIAVIALLLTETIL